MGADLEAGRVVAGRYLLEAPIGEGAMGAVYRAMDQTLKRQVAIKLLFVKGSRDPQAMIDQFLREARIAASVQHRNVIQTVDFGTVDQYQPFMVMELLDGESLGERLAREPALTSEQVIHIVSLTLRGLAAVHDAGIVHRDLKPQNIFLQRDADAVYPKILDFGISRSLQHGGDRPSAIATQEGLIVGTPDYMSPEQARGEADIDKRADIYGMAVILYEGLTGRLPFEAQTVGDLIVQIVTQEPPSMHAINPAIPESLSEMVAQAMAKKREHRFADARAMRRALLAAADGVLRQGVGAMASLRPVEAKPTQQAPASNAADRAGNAASARVSGAGAATATWGDFEGLDGPRIVDSPPPPDRPPSLAPASKNQRRMVARLPEASQAPVAPGGNAAKSSVSNAGRRAESGQTAKRGSTAGSDVALDPLYAGAEQAAPEIDYARLGPSVQKREPRLAPRTRSVPRTRVAQQRVRYKRSFWPWLLPVVAVTLLGYLFWKSPTSSAPESEDKERAALGSRAADSGLKQLRLLVKARRENPGKAPPHMRDVVF